MPAYPYNYFKCGAYLAVPNHALNNNAGFCTTEITAGRQLCMKKWILFLLPLFFACSIAQQQEALDQSRSLGQRMAAAIQQTCSTGQPASVRLSYFESTGVTGSGKLGDNQILVRSASPILVNMLIRNEQYDCGILWSPCALRIGPVMSYGQQIVIFQSVSDSEVSRAQGANITIGAPPGPARIERLNCVQVQ